MPLALTFMAEFASLTSFLLLISVMPMLAAAAGASSAAVGLITGALLAGSVIAEAAAAFAIKRFGYRVVLAAGALLLGAPTLALLSREPQTIMTAFSRTRWPDSTSPPHRSRRHRPLAARSRRPVTLAALSHP